MDLPSKKVFDALLAKGVDTLHHANTVLTATQFLRHGALLSRGTVERRKLFQTPQQSDSDDKKFNVWFDVFTDSVDIHLRASRPNAYGPALFLIDIEALRKTWTGRIWITKCNPTKWSGRPDAERWFRSIEEIEEDFNYGTFDQMIVFRHCGGELPFGAALKEILLDDPGLTTKNGTDLYNLSLGALQLAAFEGGILVPIRKRNCEAACLCKKKYADTPRRTFESFAPKLIRT